MLLIAQGWDGSRRRPLLNMQLHTVLLRLEAPVLLHTCLDSRLSEWHE